MKEKTSIFRGCAWDYKYGAYYQIDFFSTYCLNYLGDDQGFRCVYPINREPNSDARVLRGGSWYYADAEDFHAHYRPGDDPDFRNSHLGFRCVYKVATNDH